MKSIAIIILILIAPLSTLIAQTESAGYEKADIVVTQNTVTTYTEYNIIMTTTITTKSTCSGTGSESCTPGTETVTATVVSPRYID